MFWVSYVIIIVITICIMLALSRRLYFTVLLLIANIAIFFIVLTTPGGLSSDSYFDLGLNPYNLVHGIALYTLVTSMFMHANILHITFNMLWLAIIGLMLEDRIGKLGFGLTYFVTGIVGGIVFSFSNGFQPAIVIGASGALYGIFGAFVRLYPFEKLNFYFLSLPAYIWFLIFIGLDFLMTVFQNFGSIFGNIAYTAHIGGGVCGFLLAPYISKKFDFKHSYKKFTSLEPLATTLYQKEMLDRLNAEEDSAIRKNWLDEFVNQAKCPECGGKLVKKLNKIVCENGDYKIKI